MVRTHQDRLPKELELVKIKDMFVANRYLKQVYMPAFNEKFYVTGEGTRVGFCPLYGSGSIGQFMRAA